MTAKTNRPDQLRQEIIDDSVVHIGIKLGESAPEWV
jgi:4-hydroxy-3-methylbut-2-enyl diphosphate reductase IspH